MMHCDAGAHPVSLARRFKWSAGFPRPPITPAPEAHPMTTTTLYYVVAIGVGIVAGTYLPMNGRFGEQVGSPLLATAVFFLVGAVTAVTLWFVLGDGATWTRLSRGAAPFFLLGMVSFAIIFCATFFIPRMGAGAYFVCLVAGQVLAGLALSHFGLFAPERLPITPLKALGAIAVIAGVICIRVAESNDVRPAQPSEVAKAEETDTASR